MKKISLSEFQHIAGLSDSAIMHLLRNNQLDCELDAQRGLMIDVDAINVKELMNSLAGEHEQLVSSKERLIVERLSRVVNEEMERVFDEAVSRYLSEQRK